MLGEITVIDMLIILMALSHFALIGFIGVMVYKLKNNPVIPL